VKLAALSLVLLGACAARAPSLTADHPADPAAPAGRLAGPPAILRAARPAAAPAPDAPPPPAPPAGTEHDHDHH